jgi:hypothetical protein
MRTMFRTRPLEPSILVFFVIVLLIAFERWLYRLSGPTEVGSVEAESLRVLQGDSRRDDVVLFGHFISGLLSPNPSRIDLQVPGAVWILQRYFFRFGGNMVGLYKRVRAL